jgi:hypothetical protein
MMLASRFELAARSRLQLFNMDYVCSNHKPRSSRRSGATHFTSAIALRILMEMSLISGKNRIAGKLRRNGVL